ncbi:hypothetical protein RR46_01667 [Papilio xuthus]|uniref:Uncharacterized protein n=1 Tax=Papilio xuthus TaxID=66420 RepID=A0A0N0PAC3_PAPXU|nr:hypothetical protein RR46_01667 [Papilio xuthus]
MSPRPPRPQRTLRPLADFFLLLDRTTLMLALHALAYHFNLHHLNLTGFR